MHILLDCRPIRVDRFNAGKYRFMMTCAAMLTGRHGSPRKPGDVDWMFLVRKKDIPFLPADTMAGQKTLPSRSLPPWLGWNSLHNRQLVSAARRYKPDLLLTTEGLSPSRLPCPQRLWIPEIVDRPLPSESILRTRPFPNPLYRPLSGSEKDSVKQEYSEGAEYFLALVAGSDTGAFVQLLKAFSQFKKRQRSGMRLLVVVAGESVRKLMAGAKFDTYLYRTSVEILDEPAGETLARLAGAAYAYVLLRDSGFPAIDILNGWAAGAPVITVACPPGLGNEGLLRIDGNDTKDQGSLAAHLMRIYTNEAERGALLRSAAAQLLSFDREQALDDLWDGILQAKG